MNQIEKIAKDIISLVKKLPYEAKVYIQEEKGKFVVYVASGGSKLPEFYKEFDDKSSALKEFKNVIIRATKDFKKI